MTAAWRLDGVRPEGDVVPLDEREETFDVAGQTRPFHVRARSDVAAAPPLVGTVRLTALTRMELVQLEVFEA